MPGTTEPRRSATTARPQIHIGGALAFLDPAIDQVGEVLSYARMEFSAKGPSKTEYRFYEFDFRGRLQFPVGMVTRVAERLRSLGCVVSITDHRRFGQEHRPDETMLDQATGHAFFRSIADHWLGQIEVADAKDTIRRAVQIYRLFASAKIVIAVSTRKRAWRLRNQLADATGKPIGLECGGSRRKRYRLTVSSFQYLNGFDPADVHVLLLADADELDAQVPKEAIGRMTVVPKRVYALVRTGRRRGPAERLSLEAMAGAVIHRVGKPPADVQVLVCHVRLPLRHVDLEGLERKRRGIWQNQRRNALIGRIAKAAAARNATQLRHLGLAITPARECWLAGLRDPRVFVLAESLEHARQLQANLLGWPVLSASSDHDDGDEAATGARAIVTLSFAAKHRLSSDVFIAADAAGGMLACRSFPPPARSCIGGQFLLVDFLDRFDAQANRESQQRFREYAARGWTVTNAINPAVTSKTPEPDHGQGGSPKPSSRHAATGIKTPHPQKERTVATPHPPRRLPEIPNPRTATGTNRATLATPLTASNCPETLPTTAEDHSAGTSDPSTLKGGIPT